MVSKTFYYITFISTIIMGLGAVALAVWAFWNGGVSGIIMGIIYSAWAFVSGMIIKIFVKDKEALIKSTL